MERTEYEGYYYDEFGNLWYVSHTFEEGWMVEPAPTEDWKGTLQFIKNLPEVD